LRWTSQANRMFRGHLAAQCYSARLNGSQKRVLAYAQGNLSGVAYAGNHFDGGIMMSFDKPIRRIAIVGTGVIGASWAAQYLARGFDVIATRSGRRCGSQLAQVRRRCWIVLNSIGLSPGARATVWSLRRYEEGAGKGRTSCRKTARKRVDFKIKLYADMDAVTPPDSLIASSSSTLTMSVVQAKW